MALTGETIKSHIKELNLEKRNITELENGAFKNFTSVTTLRLINNNIR